MPTLADVPFAIEGDLRAIDAAKKIVRDLHGEAFPIRKRDKAAYHAFSTMICPLLVSLLATSETVAEAAGIVDPGNCRLGAGGSGRGTRARRSYHD